MQRFKAILAYDGTPYHGWQVQPGRPTVQGALAESIAHLTGETTLPQGSGRTDAGVHALAQVAHFDLACNIPPQNLHRALNRSLPPSIRVLALTLCPTDFHARHSALRKTYEYRILPRASTQETICSPFLAPYLWTCPFPLNYELLHQAARHILGTHDFTSFAAADPDQSTRQSQHGPPPVCKCPVQGLAQDPSQPANKPPPPPPLNLASLREAAAPAPRPHHPTPATRTIHSSAWRLDDTHNPPILRYRVTGSGFLHHMVRNLVGTFVECGAGRLSPTEIPTILAKKDRRAAGPTAPAHGLFLAEVIYE